MPTIKEAKIYPKTKAILEALNKRPGPDAGRMRLAVLTALVMVAFAANSVVTRAAVVAGEIRALDFALLRALAGAAMLVVLIRVQRRRIPVLAIKQIWGGTALGLYLLGFSAAYGGIDAGIGALILFGCVQLTMFAGGLALGERPGLRCWVGAGVALSGLGWLVWPAGGAAGDLMLPGWAVLAMAAAGLGGGLFSLIGRGSTDPLGETGASFVWATVMTFGAVLARTGGSSVNDASALGLFLAGVSGAVTSGLGYALWYAVLPRIGAVVAGLVQMSVPVIAALGGVVFLAESPSLRMLAAGAVVLGGIGWGLSGSEARAGGPRGG